MYNCDVHSLYLVLHVSSVYTTFFSEYPPVSVQEYFDDAKEICSFNFNSLNNFRFMFSNSSLLKFITGVHYHKDNILSAFLPEKKLHLIEKA